MITLINLLSLITGLLALTLPLIFIRNMKKASKKHLCLTVFASMAFCIIAIFVHLIQVYYLAMNQQWTNIADSIGFILMMSSILLIASFVSNGVAIHKYFKFSKKTNG